MHKITIFTTVESKTEWNYLVNHFHVDGYNQTPITEMARAVASLAVVLRVLNKAGTRPRFAIVESSSSGGGGVETSPAFGTAFFGYNTRGLRPLNGELQYRDVARFRVVPSSGRTGNLWFHGLFDSSEIQTNSDNNRFAVDAAPLAQLLNETASSYRVTLLSQIALVPHGATSNGLAARRWPCQIATSHYTDAHAVTRWRKRLKGKLVASSSELFGALEAMFSAYETAQYWLSLGIRIAPGDVWSNMVGAIGYGPVIYQAIKSASQAGSQGGGAEQSEPTLRYGMTWAAMLSSWDYAKTQADEPLQKLIEKFPPHYESGDQYIDSDFLQHYFEMLEKILKQVAATACSDWYNPKSYSGQLTNAEMKRQGDILDLLF